MPSVVGRLVRFARSPQGRRVIAGARKAAKDPKNRERLELLRKRLARPR
jgi:hypothetical protein